MSPPRRGLRRALAHQPALRVATGSAPSSPADKAPPRSPWTRSPPPCWSPTGGCPSQRTAIHNANTVGTGIADLIRANIAAGSGAATSTGRPVDERPPDLGVSCNVILHVRRVVQVPDWSRNSSCGWVPPAFDVALCLSHGSSRVR